MPENTSSSSSNNDTVDPTNTVHRDTVGPLYRQPDTPMWLRGDAKGKLSCETTLSVATKIEAMTIPPATSSVNSRHTNVLMNSKIRFLVNNMMDEISTALKQIHYCLSDNNKLISTTKSHDWSKYLQSLQRLGVDTSAVDLSPVIDHLVHFSNQYYNNKIQWHSTINWKHIHNLTLSTDNPLQIQSENCSSPQLTTLQITSDLNINQLTWHTHPSGGRDPTLSTSFWRLSRHSYLNIVTPYSQWQEKQEI